MTVEPHLAGAEAVMGQDQPAQLAGHGDAVAFDDDVKLSGLETQEQVADRAADQEDSVAAGDPAEQRLTSGESLQRGDEIHRGRYVHGRDLPELCPSSSTCPTRSVKSAPIRSPGTSA